MRRTRRVLGSYGRNDKLTQARLKELLHYDPETGHFTWIKSLSPKIKTGSRAGTIKEGKYIRIKVEGNFYYAHRLAFLYMTGEYPEEIDHDDRNGLNNKWDNLLNRSHMQNMRNVGKRRNNTSGYIGVWFNNKNLKWVASIALNYKRIDIGNYKCPTAAYIARIKKETELNLK